MTQDKRLAGMTLDLIGLRALAESDVSKTVYGFADQNVIVPLTKVDLLRLIEIAEAARPVMVWRDAHTPNGGTMWDRLRSALEGVK